MAFDPSVRTFNIQNAYWLAKASQLAYSGDRNDVALQYGAWGFDQCQFYDRRGTQALIAKGPAATLVAFRGTEPTLLEDWLADLSFLQGPDPHFDNLEVHGGFRNALDMIWDTGVSGSSLASGIPTNIPVWFTGHSLGGALATLAAARWARSHMDMTGGVYTFGSPRVGSKAFAQAYDQLLYQRTFRFVHDADIVPRFPQRQMGFWHVGTFAFLDNLGALSFRRKPWLELLDVIDPVRIRDATDALIIRRLTGAGEWLADTARAREERISDHVLERYIAHIARSANGPGPIPSPPTTEWHEYD